MTYQPPPPGSPYPPGPPGGYQPPGGGQPKFDPKAVNPMDWAILAIAVLTLIFSTFGYYTVSASGFGSDSASAWHGFFGWFAVVLVLAAAVILALELFMPSVKLPFPNRLVILGLFALATLCVLLALFITPGKIDSAFGIKFDYGRGVGYWFSLILIIAGLVLSFLRLKATGGSLPWENRSSAGAVPGGYPPPPSVPGGYPPAGQGGYPPAGQGGYPQQSAPGGYTPPAAPPPPGGYTPPPAAPPTAPGGYPPPPAAPPQAPGSYPPPPPPGTPPTQ